MYMLLREGNMADFNSRKSHGEKCDLTYCDFRGLNLSAFILEGASINGARISGTYLPRELSADEITLSLQRGTRLRYSSKS